MNCKILILFSLLIFQLSQLFSVNYHEISNDKKSVSSALIRAHSWDGIAEFGQKVYYDVGNVFSAVGQSIANFVGYNMNTSLDQKIADAQQMQFTDVVNPQFFELAGTMGLGLVVGKVTPAGAKGTSTKALQTFYPSNDGAIGATEKIYLKPGMQIDRFGKLTGKYFSPKGTPLNMRALPPNADLTKYRVFEVVKPFQVDMSTIGPAFNQMGLGTQYYSPVSAEILLKWGIIK
jgi:hypothetical protein